MDFLAASASRQQQTESWISRLTLVLGAIAALPVGYLEGWRWGAGLLIGAALAWLNFRWLKQGLDALTQAFVAQPHSQNGKVPLATYVKALLRYGLIGLAVYVIFRYLNVPVVSMVLGLCALGAATLVISVHEILRPQE